MDFPNNINDALAELDGQFSIKELKKISKGLTEKYKNESGNNMRLVNSDVEAYTYLRVRFPATYMAVMRTLEMVFENYNDTIESVLDIGAGVGTASLAVYNYLNSKIDFKLIEREESMIKLGNELIYRCADLERFNYEQCNYLTYDFKEKYDLIIASYTLNELKEEDRKTIIEKLWSITNKLLIIIEPGTKEGYNQIVRERDYLLSNNAHIIAPCGTSEKCPLQNDDWCHFSVRVPRSKTHKSIKGADVPYEDEKFSFIAVSKDKTTELKERVLRHPIIKPGNVAIRYCSQDGIQEKTFSKKDGDIYKNARKFKVGDCIN